MTDNRDKTQDRAPCAAKGCTRFARSWNRWCHAHANRYRYTRDPKGRILRARRDLGPYRKQVAEFLPKWQEHPAMHAAIAFMDRLLVQESTYNGSSGVHRAIARELRRLRMDGATGAAMLARVLAVWGYAYNNQRTWDDGDCHTVNIGSQLIRTTPRPGAGKVPGRVVHAIGREVREALGLLPREFWQAVERETQRTEQARAAIAQGLRDAPLA